MPDSGYTHCARFNTTRRVEVRIPEVNWALEVYAATGSVAAPIPILAILCVGRAEIDGGKTKMSCYKIVAKVWLWSLHQICHVKVRIWDARRRNGTEF